MKKLFFGLSMFVILSSVTSCAKCFTCKNAKEKVKFCTKDEEDKADIDNAIENYEDAGYKCTASSEAL